MSSLSFKIRINLELFGTLGNDWILKFVLQSNIIDSIVNGKKSHILTIKCDECVNTFAKKCFLLQFR